MNPKSPITVADGEFVEVRDFRTPLSLLVLPAPGAEALVTFTNYPSAVVEAGGARWVDWSYGAVTEDTAAEFSSPLTGLRLYSTGGETTFSWRD